MSGVITGPYFRKYFHNPTRYEIGTMVAILEIGAFSPCHLVAIEASRRLISSRYSDLIGSWPYW